MNRFFVDAETDGLYGSFLSIGVVVTDQHGQELEHFYGALNPQNVCITSAWTQEHVAKHLKNAEIFYSDEKSLQEAFWSFWLYHRESCICIADVAYPVEGRLFASCVNRDLAVREMLGPFPLYDLSTLLAARGLPTTEPRDTMTENKKTPHDALNDARMTAELWNRWINEKEI